MREIKFRIWTKKLKAFASNFYHRNNKRYSLNEILSNISSNDEHVLMQYIGQKDKNGKKIYEGDIIESIIGYSRRQGEIFWSNENSAFGICWKNGEGTTQFRYDDFPFMSSKEVIGNIYENPELRIIKNE